MGFSSPAGQGSPQRPGRLALDTPAPDRFREYTRMRLHRRADGRFPEHAFGSMLSPENASRETLVAPRTRTMLTTSSSLLERLRQPDGNGQAWDRFVTLYSGLLYYWARS